MPNFAPLLRILITKNMSTVHIIDHPMIQHKLTIMRDKNTGSKDFRQLLTEISLFMGYEITRDLPLTYKEIETPICKMSSPKVSGRKLAIVPILRAGMGMLDGMLTLIPVAAMGSPTSLWNIIASCLKTFSRGW